MSVILLQGHRRLLSKSITWWQCMPRGTQSRAAIKSALYIVHTLLLPMLGVGPQGSDGVLSQKLTNVATLVASCCLGFALNMYACLDVQPCIMNRSRHSTHLFTMELYSNVLRMYAPARSRRWNVAKVQVCLLSTHYAGRTWLGPGL